MAGWASPEAAIRLLGRGDEHPVTSARERLLGEAFMLFYAEGIRAVGIDLLIARASVAKATFYRHFASKNDLIVAYLDRRHAALFGWLTDYAEQRTDDPAERLLAVFDALAELFRDPDYRGCPVINAVAEVGAGSPLVLERAVAHKAQVRRFAEGLAREAGVAEPRAVAEQWTLLVDGAFVAAQRTPGPAPARAARHAVEMLLDRDGRRPARRPAAPRRRPPGAATTA